MKLTKNNHSQEQSQRNRKLKMPSLAFFICLIISSMLWAAYTFAREYTISRDCIITYSDLPEGKTNATFSSPTLTLTFRAKGFNFLQPRFAPNSCTINLSINKLIFHKGSNFNSYRFTKNELKDYIKDDNNWNEYFIDIDAPTELTVYLK